MKPIAGRPGLRSSVTATFAAGALAVSVTLAVGTYLSARHYLVEGRERTAMRQAFTDAALVRAGLSTSGADVSDVLGEISQPAGTVLYVHRSGQWYSSSLEGPGAEVTRRLAPTVRDGSAALAWTDATDPASVVVGVPLPAVGAEYYEVVSADELDSTLSTLRAALVVCALLTAIGGALLGRAASRRVLSPLGAVTTAAAQISSGDLDARLEPTEDPDLVTLVAAFNNMVDALEERIQRDARFAADVSHELRTPMTTLMTSISLLQSAQDLSERSRRAVQLMVAELDRFNRALEDLLALGRLEAGAQLEDLSPVTAVDLVRHSLDATGHVAVPLVEDDGFVDRPILVDRQQMLRALANLYQNADIHGSGLTGVRVATRGAFTDLHVEDSGPGVDAPDRERIFERFARAGSRKKGTGTGLGLSIVRQTLENHGGTVWCRSSSAGGADFVVSLPTGPAAAETENHR